MCNHRYTFRRVCIFLLLAALAMVSLVPPSPAQKPAGSGGEPTKPSPKPRVEEDVGPAKKPIRVEDRDPLAGSGIASFLREALEAKHPALRTLYSRLAVPHDEVQFSGSLKTTTWVEPLRRYV